MLGFRKKEQAAAVSVQTRPEESFRLGRAAPPGPGERALYRAAGCWAALWWSAPMRPPSGGCGGFWRMCPWAPPGRG